jgi:hypothetical protein
LLNGVEAHCDGIFAAGPAYETETDPPLASGF